MVFQRKNFCSLVFKAVLFLLFLQSFSINADSGKVVLITGASRGIGFATAELLAKQGCRVYAGVKNQNSLERSFNEKIQLEILDVTDRSTIQKTVSHIIEKEGYLDVGINNAGYALAGPLECLSEEEIFEQMNINFLAQSEYVKRYCHL